MGFAVDEGVVETSDGRTIGWMRRGPTEGRAVGWFHGQPGSRREQLVVNEETLSRFGVRLLSIDRSGYGETSPVGLDRRAVARDLLTVADYLGADRFPVMAVSMGGVYALALAALAPERITKVVLISGHVLPYDDPEIVAGLSAAEQADVAKLVGGRTAELEAEYTAMADAMAADPVDFLRGLANGWEKREQRLIETPWVDAVADEVAFGLSAGHIGLLEDGLRSVRPLEFNARWWRLPGSAISGLGSGQTRSSGCSSATEVAHDAEERPRPRSSWHWRRTTSSAGAARTARHTTALALTGDCPVTSRSDLTRDARASDP